jgi:hypothetical protein
MFAEVGDYDICSLCGWENDLIDLQEMYRPMGPNHVSLEEAQKIFAEKGPRKSRHPSVQPRPIETYTRDPKWRRLDRSKDKPREIGDPDGKKVEELYYWYWN